jgi:hypothetical protein
MARIITIKKFSVDPAESFVTELFEDTGNARDCFEFWKQKVHELSQPEIDEEGIESIGMALFDSSGKLLDSFHEEF